MIAKVVSNNWIQLEHITDAEDNVLWVEFSVSKPNAYIDPAARGNWDGIYRKYNRAKKRIARPLLGMLREICARNDLPLSIVDCRDEWRYSALSPDEINQDFLPNITLEEYQIRPIRACCKIECGIIDLPTGSGKGEVIAGICKAIPCPTMILADQRVVVDQLKRRLELRDVSANVGMFYAGKRPSGQHIVVGLIQSLNMPKKQPVVPRRDTDDTDDTYQAKLKKYDIALKAYKTRLKNVKFLHDYIKRSEMIIVDECDKATTSDYKDLFRYKFSGRRRYGLSATPIDPDKPVEAMVMHEHLGSIIFREERDSVLERGRIVKCDYNMIAFGLNGSIADASAYDIAYKEWLIENDRFHKLIMMMCQRYNDVGTLILVDRQDLGMALANLLNANGIESHFIYGKTPQKIRNETLKRFENRDFKVLIGGKIINRGLDLAGGCENLIIAGSNKLQSVLMQKVGRAFRKNQRGFSSIYDFFFRCNKYLYRQSKSRLSAMVDSGFDTKVIFPGGTIDGRELIERRFRVSKELLQPRK